MTNSIWIKSLNNEDLAEWLAKRLSCGTCDLQDTCGHEKRSFKNCQLTMEEWLDAKHEKSMPEIKAGDYILYEYSEIVYRAFCISGSVVYLIDRGVCTNFDGELKENTIAIKRYDIAKGMLEDIWRADNGRG